MPDQLSSFSVTTEGKLQVAFSQTEIGVLQPNEIRNSHPEDMELEWSFGDCGEPGFLQLRVICDVDRYLRVYVQFTGPYMTPIYDGPRFCGSKWVELSLQPSTHQSIIFVPIASMSVLSVTWWSPTAPTVGPVDCLVSESYLSPIGADVILKVGDVSLSAHKFVLLRRAANFANQVVGTKREVDLSMHDEKVVRAALSYIYRSDTNINDMAAELLVLANQCCIDDLKILCEFQMVAKINTFNLGKTYTLALKANSQRLKEACGDYLRHNKTEVFESTSWGHFTAESNDEALRLMKLAI